MIAPSALRGYVLEELLAGELRNTGFSLLVDPSQDPLALASAANGLRVRGRGADHQVDVLGELDWEIPFSLPVRLFIEAKYQSRPVGMSGVRNALGVINDVNEHYSAAGVREAAPAVFRRYHYRYSLFSASGFTADAEQFAFTQQISLIDLSTPAHRSMLRTADQTAVRLREIALSHNVKQFPVNQMREAFRRALGTWTASDITDRRLPHDGDDFNAAFYRASTASSAQNGDSLPGSELAGVAAELVEAVDGSLYFAVTNTPFLIAVRRERARDRDGDEPIASAPSDFEEPRAPQPARLAFTGRTPSDEEWALVTSDQEVVRFSTTPSVEHAILVARHDEGFHRPGTRTITVMEGSVGLPITFEALDEGEPVGPSRERRFDLALVHRDEFEDMELSTATWSWQAAEALLGRLRSEQLPQAEIIEEAARRGGMIPRDAVYRIARFAPGRTLRGFTRPARRIAAQLISDGRLDPAAAPPLAAVYQKGVLATHFRIPHEFVQFFAE